MSVCLQSQQPPPPSHHLPKPKGDATLKMRASVRVTRYLESWGAARPFAHLNHRESVSSSETPISNGRRSKVGPLPSRCWIRSPLRRGQGAKGSVPPFSSCIVGSLCQTSLLDRRKYLKTAPVGPRIS